MACSTAALSVSSASRCRGSAVELVAAAMLHAVTRELMLRRTNEELERGLPPKLTLLLACRPTEVQRALHASVVSDGVASPLVRLGMLRSLHLDPGLLHDSGEQSKERREQFRRLSKNE